MYAFAIMFATNLRFRRTSDIVCHAEYCFAVVQCVVIIAVASILRNAGEVNQVTSYYVDVAVYNCGIRSTYK